MRSRFLLIAGSLLVPLALAGCGKAGRPVQPPDSSYPHIYPDPTLGPTPPKQKEGRALPPAWDKQDLNQRFTPQGTYIDPAVQDQLNAVGTVQPGANLPYSAPSQQGNSPFSQGIPATGGSALQPVVPAVPDEEQQQ